MEQRERLIEILKEGIKPNIETDYDDHSCWVHYGNIADYLLADGWIRPPVSVGQTVYIIMDIESVHRQMLELKVLSIQIDDTMRFYCKTIKSYLHNEIWINVIENLGKTVFLTKEEAQAELERRKK